MILILVFAFFRRKNCAIFVIEPTRTCMKHKIECIFVASFKLILNNEKKELKHGFRGFIYNFSRIYSKEGMEINQKSNH